LHQDFRPFGEHLKCVPTGVAEFGSWLITRV
jgi:hypothetical protein